MAINLDVHGNTSPLEAQVQAAVNRIRKTPIRITIDDKGATQPLGNMKRGADEFTKSMEAANARILAFGASMAIINGVSDAFKGMVRNMVEVEKSLADINVVMGLSAKNLDAFSDGLFKVAKETASSFKIAADAATEYARQGLSVEESLKRTKDALILTRLTGMDSAEAVKSLTAAMNTYGHQIKDTTQLVSKFAAVDVQFAVSAEDFADAISRTGAAAKGAGVDIDELIGIVTAAQQQTARGGKVIGNSLKTIFTRVGRTDTLNQLENLGIAVRDIEGKTLGAKRILTDLANTFDSLSEAQKAQIAQTVGGVFQINVLKAILGDAAKQNGILANATQISASATDEAIDKNKELNKTISALVSQTGTSIIEMSSKLGEMTLGPGIEKILNTVKSMAEGINTMLGDGESTGNKFATGLLKGIGSVITGPGLAVITVVFLKLAAQAVKFTRESLSSLIGVTTEAQKQKAIQASLVTLFGQNAALNKEMLRTDISRTEKEKIILGLLRAQVAEATTLNTISKQAAATLYTKGYGANLAPRRGRAYGHIPNFAHPEREQAARGGYAAGNIRSMNMPGEGPIIYNSAETVKNFAGFKQPAIMPPQSSKAGKNYQQAFGNIHGFDPYAAGGYIPNFALTAGQILNNALSAKRTTNLTKIASGEKISGKSFSQDQINTAAAALQRRTGKDKSVSAASDLMRSKFPLLNPGGDQYVLLSASPGPEPGRASYYVGNKNMISKGMSDRAYIHPSKFFNKQGRMLSGVNARKVDVPIFTLDAKDKNLKSPKNKNYQTQIYDTLKKTGQGLTNRILRQLGMGKYVGKRDILDNRDVSAMGGNIFEAVIGSVLGDKAFKDYADRGATARIDLPYDPQLYELFGVDKSSVKGALGAEAKISGSNDNAKDAAKKFYDMLMGGRAATGYIPNFAAAQLALTGGLVRKNKFGNIDRRQMTRLVRSNPYFNNLMNEYLTWDSFPKKDKRKLSRWLLKQGVSNRALQAYGLASMHGKSIAEGISNIAMAGGYIPNFANPLSDAIGRERAAGVPVSQIRVGSHGALMNKDNPLGLGVTNTKDEPNGLRDVFGANGYVPNYVEGFRRSDVNISGRNLSAQDKLVEELNRKLKVYIDKFKKGSMNQQQLNNAIAGLSQKTKNQSASSERVTRSSNESIGYISRLNASRRKLTSRLGGMVGRMGRGMGGGMGAIGIGMASGFVDDPKISGALQGASSGAMIGSMLAPVLGPLAPFGSLIGTASGALYGFISATDDATEAQKRSSEALAENISQSLVGVFSSSVPAMNYIEKMKPAMDRMDKLVQESTKRKEDVTQKRRALASDKEAAKQSAETYEKIFATQAKGVISNALDELPKNLKFQAPEILTKEERGSKDPEIKSFTASKYKSEIAKLQDPELIKKAYEDLILGLKQQKDENKDLEEERRNGVLKQLNMQKVMLLAQQAAVDSQFKIKEKNLAISSALEAQEKMFGHLMNEEQKAKLKYNQAINKAAEKFELAENAAEESMRTGILQQLQQGDDKDVLQSQFKQILNTDNITEELGRMSYNEIISALEKIKEKNKENKGIQQIINRLIDNQISKKDALINKAQKEKDLSDLAAKNQLDLNTLEGRRVDDLKRINQEMTEYVRQLSHAIEMQKIEQNIARTAFASPVGGRGLYRSEEEKIQLEEGFLRSRISDLPAKRRQIIGKLQQELKLPELSQTEIETMSTRDLRSTFEAKLKSQISDPETAGLITAKNENIRGYESRIQEINKEISSKPFISADWKELDKERASLSKKLNEEKESLNVLSEKNELTDENRGKIQKAINELDSAEQKEKGINKQLKSQLQNRRDLLAYKRGEALPGDERSALTRGMSDSMAQMRDEVQYMNYELGQNIPRNFADGLASAMTDALNGAKDLDDALTDAAINFLGAIQQALMQQAAYSIVGGLGFNMNPRSRGGNIRNYSRGGGVPAMVTNGEYVMNRNAVNKYGGAFMHSLNAGGKLPGFSNGGSTMGLAQAFGQPINAAPAGIKQTSLAEAFAPRPEIGSMLGIGKYYGGSIRGFADGGAVPGSAVSAGFGGGKHVVSGRAYQSKPMSGYFYSGQAGSVALQEDESALMGVLAEEERQRQAALQKKAKRRALLQQVIGTVASVGINYALQGINFGGQSADPFPAKPTGTGTVLKSPSAGWDSISRGSDLVTDMGAGFNPGAVDKVFGINSQAGPWKYPYFGGKINKYASGGYISGKSGIDQIPAMLSEGEYVIRASSARQIGKPMLDMINAGKFNEGGPVTPMQESSDSGISGGNTNNINISINMERGKSSEEKSSDSDVGTNPAEKSQEQQNSSQLAERIKAQVVSVIVEEQRPGGLLSGKS